MTLGPPVPILRIFDEAKAREFYLDYLGFEVAFEHRFEENMPLYMGIARDGCVLHLSEHYGDATPGSSVRIHCDALGALERELTAKAYKYYRPAIERQPWASDMKLLDPFGNTLIFTDD